MASQLGPPANFRCNEFGHMCTRGGGAPMHPDRNAPNLDVAAMVSYDTCSSNDTEGYLLSAADTANRIKSLKNDPGQVLVAAITGPATPYTVTWKAPSSTDTSCNTNMQTCPWPVIAHSCTASDGSFADPGVRIADFVNQFGANGLLLPICATDFAPSLQRIGDLINATLQPPCITQAIATKANGNPDCTVVSHTQNNSGVYVDSVVSYCGDNGNAAPCWTLVPPTMPSAACPNTAQVIQISMDPNLPASTAQNATVNCALQ
jgi:hypothetical protein